MYSLNDVLFSYLILTLLVRCDRIPVISPSYRFCSFTTGKTYKKNRINRLNGEKLMRIVYKNSSNENKGGNNTTLNSNNDKTTKTRILN